MRFNDEVDTQKRCKEVDPEGKPCGGSIKPRERVAPVSLKDVKATDHDEGQYRTGRHRNLTGSADKMTPFPPASHCRLDLHPK